MDILIACALKQELVCLKERLRGKVSFLVTGLGQRTQSALGPYLARHQPDLLIFTGTAGQLDPLLKLGQVLFPERWCFENGNCYQTDQRLVKRLRRAGWDVRGQGLTVSTPVISPPSRLRLFHQFGTQLCDMESAHALQVASQYGVPCLAPKVISDTSDQGLLDYWVGLEDNLKNLADYLREMIPRCISPEPVNPS